MPTPHVALKVGAAFPTLAPAGIRILATLDAAAQSFNRTFVVTSGSESRGRLPTDPHMTGEALDVSVNTLTPQQIRDVYYFLFDRLSPTFTVLLEAPRELNVPSLNDLLYRSASATALHLHIQRRKGTTWPPM